MENYKNTKVNSNLNKFARVAIDAKLYEYLYRRVWEDDDLLGGFFDDEIRNIIEQTIEKYGDEINHFVAVALEKVADEFEKDSVGDCEE